jgi:hypothetical protein
VSVSELLKCVIFDTGRDESLSVVENYPVCVCLCVCVCVCEFERVVKVYVTLDTAACNNISISKYFFLNYNTVFILLDSAVFVTTFLVSFSFLFSKHFAKKFLYLPPSHENLFFFLNKINSYLHLMYPCKKRYGCSFLL